MPALKKTPVSHQGFLPQVPGQRADQPSGASPPASLGGGGGGGADQATLRTAEDGLHSPNPGKPCPRL